MICRKCGNYTQGEPKFCPFCGTPNSSDSPNTGSANGYDTQSNPESHLPFFNGGGVRSTPIEKRSIGICVLLSLVTCGLYAIYWLCCVVDDLKTASNSIDEPGSGMVLLLSLVTCGIYGLFWFYKAGEQVGKIKYGVTGRSSSDGWLYVLLTLVSSGLIPLILIQNELNQVATC